MESIIMKKLISLLLVLTLGFTSVFTGVVSAEETASSATGQFRSAGVNFVKKIGAGWNLGNTFENYVSGKGPLDQEIGSCNKAPVTQDLINKVADTGFNAIRIPISWGPQTTNNNGVYTVNKIFINRIKEVVKWCYERRMYVIINMHHDDGHWLNISASETKWQEIKEQYKQTWEQIAEAFKGYDERLILEGANEITANTYYCGCGSSLSGKCWWGHSQKVFDRQNELYKIFYDTVRKSGGNNDKRYLMFPTYGAQWYENQVAKLWLPEKDNHTIVDIHWYETNNQVNTSKRQSFANMWVNYTKPKNIGVVIGECGFKEADDAGTKINWANSFVKDLRQNYQIPVFLWDDGGNMRMLERDYANNSFYWTDRSSALVQTVVRVSPYSSSAESFKGDVDQNGIFELLDIIYFMKYLQNTPDKFEEMPNDADMNKDGQFDMKDYLLMRKLYAGID